MAEQAAELARWGEVVAGPLPAVGYEALGVGGGLALRPGDLLAVSRLAPGALLALGVDPRCLLADLLGRRGGLEEALGQCRGDLGGLLLPSEEPMPRILASAVAVRLAGDGRAVLGFLPEAEIGGAALALDEARREGLPLVLLWIGGQVETAVLRVVVEAFDVTSVFEAVRGALERAGQGEGPILVDATGTGWSSDDPVSDLEGALAGSVAGDEGRELRRRCRREVEEALAAARSQPARGAQGELREGPGAVH